MFPNKPAFGVLKSVIAGRNRQRSRNNATNETISDIGAMPRFMGNGKAWIPSSAAIRSSDSPGEEIRVTSKPARRSDLRRPLSTRQV